MYICTFVPDSPAMYLGNDDEGSKIRLRPKLNNPFPCWVGEPSLWENFGVGLTGTSLLNSSGIAGIYHARCLGKSSLCRSQIRGLRMSHRLFLECTRGPDPWYADWLIKRAFTFYACSKPTSTNNKQLTKGCSWPGTWTFYGAVGSPIIPSSWKTWGTLEARW